MAKVRVTAGTVTNGEWAEGRGRFGSYLRDGRVFPCGGYVEMDDSDLTDEQREDPCLRIVEVAEPEPLVLEPDLDDAGNLLKTERDDEPAVMVEPDDAPGLDPVAKSGKKSK